MPYVGIKEAAERLGVSQDTVRRRIKAGEIEAQQEPMGSGYRWLVEVPEDAGAAAGPQHGAETPADLSAAALELADARARLAGLERLVEELAADRDAWKEHAHRSQIMAETAQRLAERAQALALPPGPPEPGSPPADASEGTTTSQGHPEDLWAAVRRLLGGG